MKQLIAIFLVLFSVSSLAGSLPQKIYVLNKGEKVASLDVPLSTKIEVSSEKQEVNAGQTEMIFKGKVKLSLTFSSGDVMNINADELLVVSGARNVPATRK